MTELADIDQQLAELGAVPGDVDELLARYGEDDLSAGHIDSLLDSLSQGVEQAQVEALGVDSVPPPKADGDQDRVVDAGPEPVPVSARPARPMPAAPMAGGSRDTLVDRPSVPIEAPSSADDVDDDFQAAPAVAALFDEELDGDDGYVGDAAIELSLDAGAHAEGTATDADASASSALDGATDGIFDTLEDEEPVHAQPEPGEDRSLLKELLREEMNPGDFPQTPSAPPSANFSVPPPVPQAARGDGPAEDEEFELLVDEDDFEEIDIEDDELELIDD